MIPGDVKLTAMVLPTVHVMMASPLPQAPANGREDWEAWRAVIIPGMQAFAAATDRVSLCDVGSLPAIGDPANFATYYQFDFIHLSVSGDQDFADELTAQIIIDRAASGIA